MCGPSLPAFTAPSPSLPHRRTRIRLHLQPHACATAASKPPPRNVDETITLAGASLDAVLNTGAKRAKLSAVIPGLNPLIEDAVPYSDTLLNNVAYGLTQQCLTLASVPSVAVLFKSAGTAAAARASLGPVDERVTFGSYFRRDGSGARVSQHANLVVNPTSARGDRIMDDLEAVLSEAPDATWVLLNADMGIDRAAVGMREIARRDDFLAGFVDAFYFRNLFEIKRPQLIAKERGALLYTYPGPWRVYALAGGSYIPADEFDTMPRAEAITSCVRRAAAVVARPSVKDPSAEAVDKQFLQILALCAAAFAVVYAALVVGPRV